LRKCVRRPSRTLCYGTSARGESRHRMAVEAQTPSELEAALVTLSKERVGAVIVIADAFFNSQRRRLVELALQARLPTRPARIRARGRTDELWRSLFEFYRRAASYVDKIFKGAKPADLPIEQPTLFKLVINRKTADALGVTIPSQLYIFADEVIE
jgi:putative tryptophan/tyrosine transport system substrate-binding protein